MKFYIKSCPWNSNWCTWLNLEKYPVKIRTFLWKRSNLCSWKWIFFPSKKKKTKKRKNLLVKKKGCEKGRKWAKKRAWNSFFARKKLKKWPKMAFTGTFFFSRKKKTATRLDPWEILWSRYWCPPASPINGCGTERALRLWHWTGKTRQFLKNIKKIVVFVFEKRKNQLKTWNFAWKIKKPSYLL